MINLLLKWRRRLKALKWLSPGSFALCAVAFVGVFFVLHLAGWRERTSVFCGTVPLERKTQLIQSFQAVSYTLMYFAAVIMAPILLLAAGFSQLLVWRVGRATRTIGPQADREAGSCQANLAPRDDSIV